MKKKFIITGTGRCGTNYVASILNICGVKCGHQLLNYEGLEVDLGDMDGDSSFWAIPYMATARFSKYTKILLYRDPIKTIRSIIELEMYKDLEGSHHFYPAVSSLSTPIGNVSEYYVETNGYGLQHCDHYFNIDNLDIKRLFKVIGYEDEFNHVLVDSIPKNANSRDDQKKRTLELERGDLPEGVFTIYDRLEEQNAS